MPLYQALGDDGYFVIREFSPFWLLVSRVMRRLGLDRRVTLLPGIHPVSGRPETIAVDLGVARWLAPQLLRLLGYRRSHPSDSALVLSRRPDRVEPGGR